MSVHLAQYRAQAHYNHWFNERLYDACERLDDAARRERRGAFFGSVHATLNHILLGDRIWLARFEGSDSGLRCFDGAELQRGAYQLDAELVADWDELRAARRATDAVITAFADELTDARLAGELVYANSAGVRRAHPLWVAVTHLFNHQTHHRGQVTTLLSQCGVDPGVTDFFVPALEYLRA